jgi:hypothetical protein
LRGALDAAGIYATSVERASRFREWRHLASTRRTRLALRFQICDDAPDVVVALRQLVAESDHARPSDAVGDRCMDLFVGAARYGASRLSFFRLWQYAPHVPMKIALPRLIASGSFAKRSAGELGVHAVDAIASMHAIAPTFASRRRIISSAV